MAHPIALATARIQLSGAVEYLAARETLATGIRLAAVVDAPDTWAELQAVDLSGGILPVWSGGSDYTIYCQPSDNFSFRFWHDMGHLQHGLGFTPDDETELQLEHHLPLIHTMVGADSLAARMYYADTIGQIEYTSANHRFPIDQRAFVTAYVDDPVRALNTVF